MALLRHLLYFLGIGLVTGLIVGLELWLPGSLNLQYFADSADQLGTIEYTYQAKAIAFREPQPAAARRRAGRLPKSEGRF